MNRSARSLYDEFSGAPKLDGTVSSSRLDRIEDLDMIAPRTLLRSECMYQPVGYVVEELFLFIMITPRMRDYTYAYASRIVAESAMSGG